MAEEQVTSHIQGPNGEKLQIQIGSKAIGLTVKDLLPILLLLSGLIGGYLVYANVMDAFKLIYHRQEQVIELVREQTAKIHKMFIVHQFNQGKDAADQIPLELDLPPHTQPESWPLRRPER